MDAKNKNVATASHFTQLNKGDVSIAESEPSGMDVYEAQPLVMHGTSVYLSPELTRRWLQGHPIHNLGGDHYPASRDYQDTDCRKLPRPYTCNFLVKSCHIFIPDEGL